MECNKKPMYHLSLAARDAMCSSLEALRMSIKPLAWRWCDENFYLPPESSGIPGRFEAYPYQRGLIGLMTSMQLKRLSLLKCRRVGATKCFTAAFCYLVVVLRQKMGIFHPTDSDSKRYVRDEIEPLFEYVPALRAALRCNPDKKSPDKTVNQMKFLGSTVYFNGSVSPANFRQMGFDTGVIDEGDACPREIGSEGDIVDLVRGRTDQSPYGRVVICSTPTVKGGSLIEAEFDSSKVKMERHLPCPCCNRLHSLQWENFKYHRTEDGQRAKDAYFLCPHCSGEIQYWQYPAMDENGVWMEKDTGTWYDEETDVFCVAGVGLSDAIDTVGIYIWSAYSYEKTWLDLATDWIKANNAAASGDRGKLKTFINQNLGRTTEEAGQHYSVKMLENLIGPFGKDDIPKAVETLVAGIDVQSGVNARVEILVCGASSKSNDFWIVHHEVVHGAISEAGVRRKLDEFMFGIFRREDGLMMHIGTALIDEGDGNSVNGVRAWSAENASYETAAGPLRRHYRTCKGTNLGASVHAGKRHGVRPDPRAICHFVNQVSIKDILFKKISIKPGDDGAVHISNSLSSVALKQLTGEVRKVKRSGGKTKVAYEPVTSHQAVEVLDCCVYAYAASILALQKRAE